MAIQQKLRRWQAWTVLMVLVLLCEGDVLSAPRTKELGVVRYLARYTFSGDYHKNKQKYYQQVIEKAAEYVMKESGLTSEWVDPDIFLEHRRAERDQFKRIIILPIGNWYSHAIYEGMNDYVNNGGLLITNISMVWEDDGDYVIEGTETRTRYPETFLGVHGDSSVNITLVKIVKECPLTLGLPVGEWIALEGPVSGRLTFNRSAEVVVISDQQSKHGKSEQPFLTFKRQNKGGCIYFVGHLIGQYALEDKTIQKLFRNIFSKEVLEWLCLQE